MTVREVEAKSILRKHKKVDSWFISRYGMNLYRGCTHNCAYCDGRAEGYYVDGEFGHDIVVKVNAIDVLNRELDPKRKRVPLKRCYFMIGGGVGDSYQPIEKKYQLSRRALQLIYDYGFPAHVLTKSTLVERDIDILKKINEQRRAIVSFSFSSVDEELSAIFEPHVPPPSERLKTLTTLKSEGIACGMFLLPVIPFLTDTLQMIEDAVRKASDAGVDFVIFGGMTLKEGRQSDYLFHVLQNYPGLIEKYRGIYRGKKYGEATPEYYNLINRTFSSIAKSCRMPMRVPITLYSDILEQSDLVIVVLEHIDYFLRMEGKTSPYGYAAYSLSQLKEPLSSMTGELHHIKGINHAAESVIREILETGTSSLYENLLGGT